MDDASIYVNSFGEITVGCAYCWRLRSFEDGAAVSEIVEESKRHTNCKNEGRDNY